MRSPLERRIAALRGQARRQLALHGAGWVFAGGLVAILLAGLTDWLFHLSRELRVLTLAGVMGLTGWLIWKYMITPLVVRFRDLDIALRVEQRWPGLHDRLATTVQFLELRDKEGETEDLRGSKALRDETIRRTLDEVSSIDFRQVIDPQPARRAVVTAALPATLAVLLLLSAPSACRTALARLMAPFGGTEWPKQTHLAVVEPSAASTRIARGEAFQLQVAVGRGELLPASGTVTYRYDNGEVVTRRLGVRDVESKLVDRLPEVERSFTYAVAAGDDNTAPRRVEVVPPPALSHARVVLTPPAYTGEDPSIVEPLAGTTVPGSEFDVDGVLEGSTLEIQALANKSIAQGSLSILGTAPWQPAAIDGKAAKAKPAADVPTPRVAIKPGGSQLLARFTVQGTGAFGFDLVDTDGFRSQPREMIRFNITSRADSVPIVNFEAPAGNRDVTANAMIPLAVLAEDDIGLGKIWVRYRVGAAESEAEGEAPLALWALDDATPEPGSKASRAPRTQRATFEWDLAQSKLNLSPGSVITIQAMASDLDDLRGPKTGKSREIQLRILDPDAAARLLDEARAALREEIARTLDMQRQAIRPVEEARHSLDRARQLRETERESVRNAETIQRQVSGRVADPVEGLEHKIESHLQDQANLRINNPEAKAQMEELLARARAIRDQHLTPAQESLSRANKGLDDTDPSANSDRQSGNEASSPDNAASKPDAIKTSQSQNGQQGKQSQASKSASEQSKSATGQQAKSADGSQSKSSDAQSKQSKSSQAESQSKNGRQQDAQSQQQSGQPQQQGGNQQSPQAQQQSPPQQGESPQQDLAQAENEQKAIADELQRMLDNLSEFETYRGIVDDAKDLLKQQREHMKSANDAAEKERLDGKSRNDLTDQQKADIENLGNRQSEIARDVRQLEQKMDELSKRMDAQDPLSASALREAAQQSRKRGTADKADDAGKQLAQNQMGKARTGQTEVEKDLKKLIDSLQNRRENELARLVKELKNAERELQNLRQQQARNREQTRQAAKNPNEQERREQLQRLAKEQQEIEKELRRQLQRLQKLRADTAARAGSRAAERMTKAAQQQQQGDQDDAEEAQKEQDEALAQLEEAQEELEQTRRDAEEQLAMEQLSRIKDDLANLSTRQSEMVEQTAGYAKIQKEAALSLAQKKSVVGLGRAQETIRDETTDLVDRLDAAPVFALILKRAAEAMQKASERLRKGEPTDEALIAQRLAARRFQQLLDALKPDQDGMAGGQPGGGSGAGGGNGGGGGDGIPSIAQLKLLKLLQEELNDRTEALDELRERKNGLAPDQENELARLKEEQRSVGDLARDLTQPRRDDGEE